jgi:hypothetical protein
MISLGLSLSFCHSFHLCPGCFISIVLTITISTVSISSVSVGIVAEAFGVNLSVTIVVSIGVFVVFMWCSDIIMVIVMVIVNVVQFIIMMMIVMVVVSVFGEVSVAAAVSITIATIRILLSSDPGQILPKLILCGDKSYFEHFTSFFVSLFLCILLFIKFCLKSFTSSNDVLNGRLGVSCESFLKVCIVSSKSSLL